MRDDSDVLGFVASDRGWSPDDVGGVVKQSPYIQLLSRGILELATNSHIPPRIQRWPVLMGTGHRYQLELGKREVLVLVEDCQNTQDLDVQPDHGGG